MRTLQEQILAYVPANATEAQDKKEFLEQWMKEMREAQASLC